MGSVIMRSLGIITGSLVAGLLGLLGLPACGGSEEEVGEDSANATAATADVALDVNDISVLFPLDKQHLPVPLIEMDLDAAEGGKIDLYPQSVIDGVAAFQKTQEVTSLEGARGARATWKVVGFRFDPCAPETPGLTSVFGIKTQKITHLDKDLRKCDVEIRLVAQPFVDGRDIDTAAHLVFSYGKGNAKARDRIIQELQVLKTHSPAKTAGIPLGPHPGLRADTGSFAAEVRQFLAGELAQAKLFAVASMGTKGGDPWIFAQGTVDRGQWKEQPITGFGVTSGVMSQSDFAGFEIKPPAIPGQANFVATTTPLFGKDQKPEQLTLAHQVNNPEVTGVFNTDCVSCHTATERTINKKIPSDKNRFVVPKGVTGYVEKRNANHELPADEASSGANQSTYNFRNFGYFAGQATVSYRTVNETALVVDHINRDLLKKASGPGPVCDEEKVWTCFRDGKSAADCLSTENGCQTSE